MPKKVQKQENDAEKESKYGIKIQGSRSFSCVVHTKERRSPKKSAVIGCKTEKTVNNCGLNTQKSAETGK